MTTNTMLLLLGAITLALVITVRRRKRARPAARLRGCEKDREFDRLVKRWVQGR